MGAGEVVILVVWVSTTVLALRLGAPAGNGR